MRSEHRSYAPVDNVIPEAYANSEAYAAPTPEEYVMATREPPHASSLTEVAAEAMRTGIVPDMPIGEVPGEDALLRGGDPDVDPLSNELNGDEMPGASNPGPDQNNVDDIGAAYGLSQQDGEELRSPEEIMERRSANPWNAENKDPS